MPPQNANVPDPADPNINEILDEFLADQRERLKPRTYRKYKTVIEFLVHHLNGYGHESLRPEDKEVFEHYFRKRGEGHKQFCEIFGPTRLLPATRGFRSYFLPRKVIGSTTAKKASGAVLRRLEKWLRENGYVSEGGPGWSRESVPESDMRRRAHRATDLINEHVEELCVAADDVSPGEAPFYDHYTISKVEPGRLWLKTLLNPHHDELGPVHVAEAVTENVEESWIIACGVGEVDGKLQIVQKAIVSAG